jgi:hypothetical protein
VHAEQVPGLTLAERQATRWAALGGVAYVALFIAGFLISYSDEPDTSSAPAEIVAYYSDSGNRDRIAIGWLLLLVGVFFFLWFVAALRQTVRRFMGDGLLTTATVVGGAVYAATTLVASSLQVAIMTMSDDTYQKRVFPELIHAASDAGYVIHAGGGAALAVMMVAASVAAMIARAIPQWLGWLGVIGAISAIVSIFFIPFFVIAVWLLVASVLIFRAKSLPTAEL